MDSSDGDDDEFYHDYFDDYSESSEASLSQIQVAAVQQALGDVNLNVSDSDSDNSSLTMQSQSSAPTFNEKSIVHMFLPKKTPECLQCDLEQVEQDMLSYVAHSFGEMMENCEMVQLAPVQVMLEKWVLCQPRPYARTDVLSSICSELNSLSIGNTIPIYIREQNCTMLISKVGVEDRERIRVETLSPSLPSNIVMSSVHSLKMNFPLTSNVIKNEGLLRSKIFASHLHEMALDEFELSMGTTEKGGNTFTEVRDVRKPFLVSDWAVGVLVPEEDSKTGYSVSKKVRDQVTMASKNSRTLIPFRRSGMWMSIKVALHLKILEVLEGDEETAKLVYKIAMLQVLVDACKNYENQKDRFSLDLASQMVAKVGRRVRKLQLFNCDKVSAQVELMKSNVLAYTLEVLTSIRDTIQNHWLQIALPSLASEEQEQPISRSTGEFVNDLMHSIEPLNRIIDEARQLIETPVVTEGMDIEAIRRKVASSLEKMKKCRFKTLLDITHAHIRDNNELRIWLHDTEKFIKGIDGERDFSSRAIFDLGQNYISKARDAYKRNPLGFSQILLVSLKLTFVLDKIMTRRHPLLLRFKPDINVSSFDCLLLPYENDVNLLNELVAYFEMRDRRAPKTILERKISNKSLSVLYARDNQEMIRLKDQIQRDIASATQRKTAEVEQIRADCRNLESKMKVLGGSCTCQKEKKEEVSYNSRTGQYQVKVRNRKVFSCGFCPLKKKLNKLKKSVSVYEVPFPPLHLGHFQDAVIFELLIPEEISCMRQFLAVLKYELLGEPVFNGEGNEVSKQWLKYSPIHPYMKTKGEKIISLASTVMPSSATCHSNKKPDVLLKSNEFFIVNNGMNCHFHYNKKREAIKNLMDECTFQLSSTMNPEPYKSLQKYLKSTDHFQNDVLANQSECHQKLSLNEYITFGSLRAGHRIQVRNLYMAISSRSLALEKESVLALVLQTIWQVGPRTKGGTRESHLDFKEDAFAIEFLELLEKLVQSNASNYSIPLVLLTAIFIAAKIMEVNENSRSKGYQLFKEWRELTRTWSTKVEEDLRRMNTNNAKSETNKATMQKILHEIKLCSMMTFNICSPDEVTNVCKVWQDMAHLLHTLSSKNLLARESNSIFSGFMEILGFMEALIPVRMKLDAQVNFGVGIRGQGGLSLFIEEKFPAVSQYGLYETTRISDNVVIVQYSKDYYIIMDIFTGELLINGFPETELSSQISGNIEFKRFFQKHLNFRVQRESATVLRTSDPVHGKHYEFRTGGPGTGNYMKIVEIYEDHPRLVLVPHQKFRGFISDQFVDNYTHWLDPQKETIYFRRIAVSEGDYDLPHEYTLTRFREGDSDWMFHDEMNQKFLMSINSEGYLLLAETLSRLELAKHINVFMSTKTSIVEAHLPRHNLRFALQPNGLLECLEYPGFQVSLDQNSCGTFVELENGLLLQNGIKRNIIIPHGKIKMYSGGVHAQHQFCEVDLESLSQPSFFIYEFDDVLKRIVAKKSITSWLYLAALHAATSSSQPDPFTGMTGTEMAVQILQSALVWSCSPYDMESLEILKFLKGLSPKRNYYGHQMNPHIQQKKNPKETIETIEWPKGLPPMAAYDGYAFLVNALVRDSIRLEKLYAIKENCKDLYDDLMKDDDDCSEKLLLRAYLRNSDKYNDEIKLNEDILKGLLGKYPENDFSLFLRADDKDGLAMAPMVTAAYLCHLNNASLSSLCLMKDTLIPFLFTRKPLFSEKECMVGFTLLNLLNLDFRSNWLKYYNLAISNTVDQHQYSLLLSALAYRGAPLEQINILHSIRDLLKSGKVNLDFFPPVPQLPTVDDLTRYFYDESEIARILKTYSVPFPTMYSEAEFGNFEMYQMAVRAYDSQIHSGCASIAKRWKSLWPCLEIGDSEIEYLWEAGISDAALICVNNKIRAWYHARNLRYFIHTVQLKLNECVNNIENLPSVEQTLTMKTICTNVLPEHSDPLSMEISDLMRQGDISLASEAIKIFRSGRFEPSWSEQKDDWVLQAKRTCELKIGEIEGALFQGLTSTVANQIIEKSGLFPRLNPTNLLRTLQTPDLKGHVLQQFVGALGVLWTNLKRFNRCLHCQLRGQLADLDRELLNPGHEDWSPMDRPEWLLIELELDIMIRKVQVEVAEQMENMPVNKNGVMQLNMGEGKTSVIVPMLCSILAQEDSLCRVTVLSSIFKMNWSILKFAIGGLLNRRLYSFPCRRDMKVDLECIQDIQTAYSECMAKKGVVLTLPEHRLSFRSLAYDKILKRDTEVGLKLLETEDWLRWHVRDILDESDELLSVKYQLVYTIGEQIQLDGGDVRWTMCQQILDLIQEIVPRLLDFHGSTAIEYEVDKKLQSPHEFATVRLLATKQNEKFFEDFEYLVVEKYLAGVTLTETQMDLVSQFILKKDNSLELHDKVIALLKNDAALLNKILILAGYIHRGVLSLALSKRWRVEYGVDQKGFRKMAVPFRAKDVAAERTEFGHPDLAIILTHMSYYYSGLSDNEMEEIFSILAGKLGPEAIYNEWIQHIPEGIVPPSLTNYHCLNLKDAFQKSTLFDLIRKHKMIVDFWLSHVVFPKESKQFTGKLVMTASDLAYERQRLPITGFSGTNDSIVLLPLTIDQQDLDHLQGTNERMEQVLLQEENDGHRGLTMGVTCDDILRQMKDDGLRILIDSGALMLELDNEQVAQHWLEIDTKIEAVVYFNKDNELMVKSRSSGLEKSKRQWGWWRPTSWQPATSRKIPDVPLELSPFQGKLGCCGVFLDDQHTRGTDLNFALGSKACVTIGSRMKREKLLQACMRMRKLGNGHSVTFYLSHEASNKVLGGVRGILSTLSVLNWVKGNTKEFNDDGLLHWAIASKNYAQRLAAEDLFHFPHWKDPVKIGDYDIVKANILAKQCVDQEVTALMDMYGQHSKIDLMTSLIRNWFMHTREKLIQLNGSTPPPQEIMSRFDEIWTAVWNRCDKHVPDKRLLSSSTMMDEEQEKELELEKEAEVEEERQVERPRKAARANPYLHPNVERMVVAGEDFRVTVGVVRLSDIFKNTSFAGEVQPDDWSVEVYASYDFTSVINPSSFTSFKTNSYLRPMEYFVINERADHSIQILFLSPFEVNKLLPRIRDEETACPLRMFATRKFERQDMLLNSPRLQLPSPSDGDDFWVLGSGEREMAAMMLASGSLYFSNNEEQVSYALFLSLVPKPWTANFRKLFEAGMITSSGFLVPEFRQNSVPRGFQKDPLGLVSKILVCRHPVVSDVSHVVRLLEKKTYVKLRNQEND